MRRLILCSFLLSILITGCGSLRSTTYIKAKEAFILGDNAHGRFSANLHNISAADIIVSQCPIYGTAHSSVVVKPGKSISLEVQNNTALRIENQSEEQVAVELKVRGDTGLSMAYNR